MSIKNIAFSVLICLGSFSFLSAQNLLKSTWKFQTGDDPAWARMEVEDASWANLQGNQLWERQGYNGYDGYGWYRQKVVIPSDLKEDARLNGGLILDLGPIDDTDATYWNGQSIGQTGQFPPNYEGKYNVQRLYNIPFEAIKFDEENLIAVRVYDDAGGGGFYGKNQSLRVIGMEDLVSMDVQGLADDHVFLGEGDYAFTIELENNYRKPVNGTLNCMIRSDFGELISEQSFPVKLKRNKKKALTIELGTLAPGFYQIENVLEAELENKSFGFSIGVKPEEIVSPLTQPEDFQNYWDRARRELAAVAPQFKMIRQDSLCTPEKEYFLVEMRSLGNVLVRGWYRRPTKAGKYPAILHVQGYSSNQGPNHGYGGNDMIALALNIRGHGNSQDHVNPGFPGYLQHFVDDKEMYIYRGAYMDCIRAVDFLCSRPEVDTSLLVVEGGSQGGALSFATAALDNKRIKLCVPAVPFLSDFEDYFQVAAWPGGEFINYVKENPEIGWEGVYSSLHYIDIKNLAPWVKAPVLMSIGLVDPVCPPHINFAAYNQLTVPKSYVVYPYAGHGLPGEKYNPMKYEWIRQHLDELREK